MSIRRTVCRQVLIILFLFFHFLSGCYSFLENSEVDINTFHWENHFYGNTDLEIVSFFWNERFIGRGEHGMKMLMSEIKNTGPRSSILLKDKTLMIGDSRQLKEFYPFEIDDELYQVFLEVLSEMEVKVVDELGREYRFVINENVDPELMKIVGEGTEEGE